MKKLKIVSMFLLIFGMYNVQNCSSNSQDLTCWVEPTKFVCSVSALVAMNCMQSMVTPQITIGASSAAECTEVEQMHSSRLRPIEKFAQWYRNLLKIRPLETVPQDATVCYGDKVADPANVFNVGNAAFYDKEIPQGMTREQVYKIMIAKQENYLKTEILRQLDVTPEEFEEYAKLVSENHKKFAEIVKRKQIEEEQCVATLVGLQALRFVEKVYGQEDAHALSHVEIVHNTKSEKTNDKLKILANAAQDYITFNHQAMKDLWESIEFHPVNEKEALFHELSHIRHQDGTFEGACLLLMNAVQGISGRASISDNGEKVVSYSYQSLKKESVTSERLVQAKKLFDQWNEFHERRADFESVFVLKETEEFKAINAGVPLHDEGYPVRYSYGCRPHGVDGSTVDYRADFHRGIQSDHARTKAAVKKTGWMEWLGLK